MRSVGLLEQDRRKPLRLERPAHRPITQIGDDDAFDPSPFRRRRQTLDHTLETADGEVLDQVCDAKGRTRRMGGRQV